MVFYKEMGGDMRKGREEGLLLGRLIALTFRRLNSSLFFSTKRRDQALMRRPSPSWSLLDLPRILFKASQHAWKDELRTLTIQKLFQNQLVYLT